jgi:hypothetical protein
VDVASVTGPTLLHLYPSRAEVYRMVTTVQSGARLMRWEKVSEVVDPRLPAGEVWCRLDLNFVRPGKDIPPPVAAGRAPDRFGILFCDVVPNLRSGDQVRMVEGPVVGIFELRVVPDVAQARFIGHHLEVQVVEVAQSLDLEPTRVFPGQEPYEPI